MLYRLKRLITEIYAVFYKECIHIFHDSTTIRIAVAIPLFQLIIFGLAINTEVRDLKTYIFDADQSQISRDFVNRLKASTYFKIEDFVYSKQSLNNFLKSGKASVGVIIPANFSEKVNIGETASIQALVDGSDSSVATQANFALTQVASVLSRDLKIKKRIGSKIQTFEQVEMRTRYLFNPDLETSFLILPALLGIIVFIVVSILSCLSIVREKEQGTMEQLLVTPLSPLGLMIGKIIPYIFIGLFDFNLSLFLMYVFFGIPILGNIFILEISILVFMFSALGISLLVSITSKTQAQAIQMVQMTILPSILLSGYVFPFDSMPIFFRIIGYLLPVTHFIKISRGVILRGASFIDVIEPFCWLLLFGFLFFYLSVKMFKKNLG